MDEAERRVWNEVVNGTGTAHEASSTCRRVCSGVCHIRAKTLHGLNSKAASDSLSAHQVRPKVRYITTNAISMVRQSPTAGLGSSIGRLLFVEAMAIWGRWSHDISHHWWKLKIL